MSSSIVLQMMLRMRCVAASGAIVIDDWRELAAALMATGPVSTRLDGSDRCRSGRSAFTPAIAASTSV